jgi:hypothetical protein
MRIGVRFYTGLNDILEKSQPEKADKLEYFRKKILDHLSKLEKEEMAAVNKALAIEESMVKGWFPVGTIRTWNGVKNIKMPDGKWRPKYDSNTRGAKMAISVLKKKIAAAKDEHEMMQIILANRDRFDDRYGHPLPFVQELHNYIEEQKTVKTSKPKRPTQKERIIEGLKYYKQIAEGGPNPDNCSISAAKKRYWEYREKAEKIGIKINEEVAFPPPGHPFGNNDEWGYPNHVKETKTPPAGHNETMNEILQDFKRDNPGLTKHEEFLKLNELEHKAFVRGDKEAERTASALKQEFYADEQKAHDEARKELKRQQDEKNAAEAKERSDAEKERREAESAKQTQQRGVGYMTTTFTTDDYPSEKTDNESGNFEKIQKKYQTAKVIEGDEDEVQIGKDTLSGKWKLVEADTPTASHDETTFHKTPGFPSNDDGSTINDRDYGHDKAAQDAVMDIGSDFDGRALKVDNPVIVTTDGVVISGNNRTMSSKIAAKKGTDTKYIEALKKRAKKFGFTAEQVGEFKNPRVVFEVKQQGKYTTEQFSKFNESGKKEMGPTEKAVKVSKLIKPETVTAVAQKIGEFETLGELYADRGAVQHIFNAFKNSGLVGEFEVGKYIENGSITEDGKTFIETALLGSVMNENNIRGFNRPGCKSIRAMLVRAITPLIENKSMEGYSITRELNEAADIAMQVAINRDKFKSVDEFSKQQSMFEKFDPVSVELAKKLEGTQKLFAEFMQKMNGSLKYAANGEADIFLGDVETKEDILTRFLPIKKAVIDVLNSIRGLFD